MTDTRTLCAMVCTAWSYQDHNVGAYRASEGYIPMIEWKNPSRAYNVGGDA